MTFYLVSATTSTGLLVGAGDGAQVVSGGTIVDTVVVETGNSFPDGVEIRSTGVASNTAIGHSGVQNIDDGGVAYGTTISSGGTETVAGSSLQATVSSGGEQDVNAGGVARGTVVSNGGFLFAGEALGQISGGTALAGGDVQLDGGSSINLTLIGGLEEVYLGTALGTQVSAGGVLETGFLGDARELIDSPAPPITSGATILSGGIQVAGTLVGTETFFNPDGSTALTEVISGNTTTLRYIHISGQSFIDGDTQVFVQNGNDVTFTETAPDGTTSTSTYTSSDL